MRAKLTGIGATLRDAQLIHQLDHLYGTPPLRAQLARCDTGDVERVIGSGLSVPIRRAPRRRSAVCIVECASQIPQAGFEVLNSVVGNGQDRFVVV